MSVNVDGRNLFTKEMTNVFTAEVIECPDCAFEFASKHELDDAEGCYECPCCREADLDVEVYEMGKELEHLRTVEQAYQALLSATAGQPK